MLTDFTLLGYAIDIVRKLQANHKILEAIVMKMNKKVAGILLAAMSTMIFTGCGSSEPEKKADTAAAGSKIVVISREDGSGTRGAFIELFGIEKKDANGKKVDHTTDNAAITNNTSVMMTTVAGNKDAIGYISLGSLNDTVKALKIDGAEASAANVKSGAYKIARPFNICTKDGLSEVAQDFVTFIMSKEGQEVVAKAGCIGDEKAAPYKGTKPAGKVVVAGSSSVTPAMEKLKEAYLKINPAANIEIQTSDSTTGVKSAISGICDIGMASRELKKSELDQGLKATVIATDGIAVIVNKDNKISDLKKEQVEAIFTGKTTEWNKL
jgi:phosphate transport system substrate-binding protein